MVGTQRRRLSLKKLICTIPNYDPYRDAGDCVFVPRLAQRVIDFFRYCIRHFEGVVAGKPFILEPWQAAIVANLFGWIRPDGTRRYTQCFIGIPKKNGKTPFGAGIGLYLLVADGESAPYIPVAAADGVQAGLMLRYAAGYAEADPDLEERLKVFRGIGHRAIEYKANGGVMRVMSKVAVSSHGVTPSGVIIDETHAHQSRDLIDSLRASLVSANRPNALTIHFTTQDWDRESICNELWDYANKVCNGAIRNSAFLPVIYELGQDEDWTDESLWRRVNPNLDVSKSLVRMREMFKEAQDMPRMENSFRRLQLNQRTESDVRWIKSSKWEACGGSFDATRLEGCRCVGGLDLGSTSDLTSLCLAFKAADVPDDIVVTDGDEISANDLLFLWWHWTPIEKARERDRLGYGEYFPWQRDGWLTLTDGDQTDYGFIRKDINKIFERYPCESVNLDMMFQAAQLSQDLIGDGFDVLSFGQGFRSMTAPSKAFEIRVGRSELRHGNNPVVRWMSRNVCVSVDPAGNIKPDKSKRRGHQIDGIVACIMAIALTMVDTSEDGDIYRDRPPIVLGLD